MKTCGKCDKDLGGFVGFIVKYVRHGYHTIARATPAQINGVYCETCAPAVAGAETLTLALRCRDKAEGPPPCNACRGALARAQKYGLLEDNKTI